MITYDFVNLWSKALFNLTTTDEQMVLRKEILSKLAWCLENTPLFDRFFFNPQITLLEKKKLLQKVIDDKQLVYYLLLLLEKGKFKYLPAITRRYHQLVMQSKGVIRATWETAKALDGDLKAQLEARLEKIYGKTFILDEKITPEMIGGAILTFDNRILDFSIKGRLKRMRKTLNLLRNAA